MLAASSAWGASAASGAAAPRLAAIDWAMLETAVALGHMPVAAAELIRFRADAVTPEIPPEVTDLGLRGAPNFELLQLVRPMLILSSPYYTRYEARLAQIAPVLSLPFYLPGEPPLPKAMSALTVLADRIGDPRAGAGAQRRAEADLDRWAVRLAPHADRPLALIDIGDARHLRAFGPDSLFGSTLDRLGLANAWTGRTAFSFMAPVPLERLAEMPEARLIIIGPVPPEARRGLARSVLWQALPQVAAGRVHHLPRVNAFGAVPSARRFAGLLAEALDGRGAQG
ncbi:iron-siderophore ABC transporter substrate-binding protein [Paracoccus gahaiensis]|uniref:Iron-siderophore ABC transporter substrate-binding protein n=2 Tax=Paracoccus gahaiensis TaxID=1706839 RepID=A0A4U0R4K8_9RHOB|nr:iron-siderophore ABC transporter substrate-binding protein [Paracoccus gahaiensis]